MAAEEIITVFKAEIENYKKGVLEIQTQLGNLQKEQAKTTAETEKLNKKFNDTGKAVDNAFKGNSISQELRNIQKEMQGLDAGSKKFNELAQKAGHLKDQINTARGAVQAFSNESKVTTAKNLFSQIGHDLTQLDFKAAADKAKQFALVIRGISFSEVVSGLKNFGSTLINIGKAIASNPFVILATAVAALGYALYNVTKSFMDLDKQTETAKSSLDRMKESAKGLADAYGAMIIQQQVLLGKITESQAKILSNDIKYNALRTEESKRFNDEVIKLAEELELDLSELQKNGRFNTHMKLNIVEKNNMEKFNRDVAEMELRHQGVLKDIVRNSVTETTNIKIADIKKRSAENIKAMIEEQQKKDAEKQKEVEKLKAHLEKIKQLEKEELEFRNKMQDDYNKQSEEIQKEYYARLKKDREDADADANKSRGNAIQANYDQQQKLREEQEKEMELWLDKKADFDQQLIEANVALSNSVVDAVAMTNTVIKELFAENAEMQQFGIIFEKLLTIFRIFMDTQRGIMAARAAAAAVPPVILGAPNPAYPVAQAVKTTTIAGLRLGAATSIAAIAAQTIPQLKFAEGTKSVQGGIKGRDSVNALLMPEEMVIPVKTKKKYEPLLNAIFDHRISTAQANAIAKAGAKGTTGENMVNNYSLNGIRYDEIANAGKWANKEVVREIRSLRRDIKQGVSSKLARRYGA